MQVQYDKYFDERGQITVFLSLLFLVLMMSFLFIVEGVISYSASSLGEDAVKGAGESIMANYDRELFKNYHLFFLDPRQKDYIVTDGKEFINQYFSGNSFFDIYCDSLEVTGEKTAVDEDGLYLKHEIREWMKYREEKEIAKVLEDIIRNTKKNDGERKECQEEVDSAETDVKKEQDIEDCFSFYGGSDKKDNALLYEVEYLISGKNSDIDNLKRVANYILLLRFINNYIFTGKDTQMKTHINTMASAITGVMGMPQTMKAVQVLIRMAISYGESLLELHTLFSGGEVPLIKDETTWNLTLKTMAEQLRNKQIVKKGKKNISYKDYLKLFLLTKGNSRTVCYRMMDIMQENIASKEPGFLMENCLFSYSWKGSLAAGGVKLNFVKQCSY